MRGIRSTRKPIRADWTSATRTLCYELLVEARILSDAFRNQVVNSSQESLMNSDQKVITSKGGYCSAASNSVT